PIRPAAGFLAEVMYTEERRLVKSARCKVRRCRIPSHLKGGVHEAVPGSSGALASARRAGSRRHRGIPLDVARTATAALRSPGGRGRAAPTDRTGAAAISGRTGTGYDHRLRTQARTRNTPPRRRAAPNLRVH